MRTNPSRQLLLRHAVLSLVILIWLPLIGSAQSKPNTVRKFDEFGDIYLSDLKARVDNFAIELQNNPAAKGFIIVYRSRRDLPGINARYAGRIQDYLFETRGLTKDRIVTVNGGVTECLIQELWIVPPNTVPVIRADAYQHSFDDTGSARKFDDISIGDETGIGNGTLEGFADALRKEPTSHAYFIAYAQYYIDRGSFDTDGKRVHYKNVYLDKPGRAGEVLRIARRSLISISPALASRIRLVDGGYRQNASVELWIVPAGEHAPIATPNAFPPKRHGNRAK